MGGPEEIKMLWGGASDEYSTEDYLNSNVMGGGRQKPNVEGWVEKKNFHPPPIVILNGIALCNTTPVLN